MSSDTNVTWGAGARYNTTVDADGAYTFTFNTVGEYIWVVYRMEYIPYLVAPVGEYQAWFTVTAAV